MNEICVRCMNEECAKAFNESNGEVRIETWFDKALFCQRIRTANECPLYKREVNKIESS